jgi:hypothetical protein
MVKNTENYRNKILPLRARAEVRNRWLKERLETVLPEIMKREGFDMWLVIAREYNEDPTILTLLPEPAMAARRRTILVFTLKEDGTVERLTLSRYGQPGFYDVGWTPENETQYECLARVIRERDPKRIGINVSAEWAFGDGLSHNEFVELEAALGTELMGRVKGAERVCIGWLERRIPAELVVYPGIVEMGHSIIAEMFSSVTVQPGITTTDDLVWWMRQKMLDLGFQAWFQPDVDIQSAGESFAAFNTHGEKRKLILPGDLLWCDVGFYYLGLATDQQEVAYVLKPGESDAPDGLKAVLRAGNRLQDIHMEAMTVSRTGNEVLKIALEQAKAEGIEPMVYSHPLGYHGHAAGVTIGLWDAQEGVPGKGDTEIFDETCYSIELNVQKAVPEWGGQIVRLALEQDAVMSGGKMRWLHGRQTAFHLIG